MKESKLRSFIREEINEVMSDEHEREEARRAIAILEQTVQDIGREVSRDNRYIKNVAQGKIQEAVKEIERLAELR